MGRFFPVLLAMLLSPIMAHAERVVSVPSRGQSIRVLVDKPAASRGVLVLVPGGDGDLQMTETGAMGQLSGNQLVRSRALFVRAGYTIALADIAPDMHQGEGVKPGYRWSAPQVQDLGAVIAALRQPGQPVVLVGTSRGALSVAAATARLQGPMRPDRVVITSGMLIDTRPNQPSVQRNLPGFLAATQPMLFVVHARDACPLTPPDGAAQFRPLLRAAAQVEVVTLDGGQPGRGDRCGAGSPHGFLGLDQQVTDTITRWIAR